MASAKARIDGGKVAILLACVVAGALLWDYPLMLPLKLLVVMMHESGHALASLLVGGSVDRITLAADQSGACLSSLPQGLFGQIVVYSAGYVGSTLAGGMLILTTYRFRLGRWVLGAACVWLAAMGLLYARDPFTLLFCAVAAAAMGLGAKLLPAGAVEAVNLFLAAFSTLYAVRDLQDDLWSSAVRSQSDAALLAQITYVPAVVWAALWTLASFAVLLVFARWSLVRLPAEVGRLEPAAAPARPG
jgi:hypothetical protein